jgi:hypothetical protein
MAPCPRRWLALTALSLGSLIVARWFGPSPRERADSRGAPGDERPFAGAQM